MNNQPQKYNATGIMLLILLGCAIGGMAGCVYYADKHDWANHGILSTGSNGGAIGCAIFATMALYGLVKVFIEKTN